MMTLRPLRALVYRSTPTKALDAEQLLTLATQARSLNALDGITGLLVAGSDRFCQLVEGSVEAIDALMDRLRADSRHRDIIILFDGIVQRHSTQGWDMQVIEGVGARGRFDGAQLRMLDRLDLDLRTAVIEAVAA